MTATLNELSANGTLLLVVDDLHWADQPTLLLLRHVLRNIDRRQARHRRDVHRHRGAADHRLRAELADFRAVHPVETVHLQGLSEDGVEELVQGWPNARRTSCPSSAS